MANAKATRKALKRAAAQIAAGELDESALDNWTNQANAEKVRGYLASARREAAVPASVSLIGRIARETDKAVLFTGRNSIGQELIAVWLPKSQMRVADMGVGEQITLPAWLYEKKLEAVSA